jgi:hypothetical protein
VAAYLIPLDLWYILPVESFGMQGTVGLYPKLKKSKYGRFKEVWHLLRGEEDSGSGVIAGIEACAARAGIWAN